MLALGVGLGLLATLDRKRFRVQSLVLCPTRELADQVANAIRELARTLANVKVLTLTGGTPFGPQVGSLEHGTHIVVGTPGRVDDHLRKGTLKLDAVTTLVLDEADRMLDMGFQEELDAIVDATPAKRQTLMFSATFQSGIQSVAKRIMQKPIMVSAPEVHDNSTIDQHFYIADDADARLTAVRLLLLQHRPDSAVIFCNTKIKRNRNRNIVILFRAKIDCRNVRVLFFTTTILLQQPDKFVIGNFLRNSPSSNPA